MENRLTQLDLIIQSGHIYIHVTDFDYRGKKTTGHLSWMISFGFLTTKLNWAFLLNFSHSCPPHSAMTLLPSLLRCDLFLRRGLPWTSPHLPPPTSVPALSDFFLPLQTTKESPRFWDYIPHPPLPRTYKHVIPDHWGEKKQQDNPVTILK